MVKVFRAFNLICLFVLMVLKAEEAQGAIPDSTMKKILRANRNGPYLGLVIPNTFELNPLLESPDYIPSKLVIDFSGRRFRFGRIGEKKVILVMTGLSLINAGITTQLLLSFFNIEGVVHYGIAGNANPELHVGDVAIPKFWAHTGLWNWQRYGQGVEDPLPLEASGDYTREIGFLKFANYTTNVPNEISPENFLNNIWYQPEEVFPIDGSPEERQHIFWVPVDDHYLSIAKRISDIELESCVNATTCLHTEPRLLIVERGVSNSFYLDNAAYRGFLYDKFKVSPVEMESAAIALVCYQQRVPFIVIRALSDLAGGGSEESNEADIFTPVAATNSVAVVIEFIKQLTVGTRNEDGFVSAV